MRPKLFLSLTLCAMLALAAYASADKRHDDYWKWEFTEKFERDLSGVDKVSISTINGSIKVGIWSDNKVGIVMYEKIKADNESKARELADEIKLVGEKRGSELVITVDYGRFREEMKRKKDWNYSGSLEVQLPARLSLELSSVNGSIKSEKIDGDLEVDTTNGGITLDGCGGYAELHTTNGSIHIDKVGNRVKAYTTNGRIELGEVGGEVEAHTTNGSIEIELADSMKGDVEARTTNGGITLTLSDERNIHLIADAGHHSKVYLDIPLTLAPGEYRRGFIEGKLGAGTYKVSLKTTNGSIRVKE